MKRLTFLRLTTLASSVTLAAAGVYYRATAADTPAAPSSAITAASPATTAPNPLLIELDASAVMSSSKSAVPAVPLPPALQEALKKQQNPRNPAAQVELSAPRASVPARPAAAKTQDPSPPQR